MERKIGEIFEYNGEWHQTVKSQGKCCSCDFMIDGHCIVDFSSNGSCFYCHRKDKENVIFKKLEKVGEPIIVIGRTFQKFTNSDSCVGCVFCNGNNGCDKCCYMDEPCLDNEIWIEIKQNKEDMEQEIEYFGDENTKHSNSEKIGKNLKEFNLEAAKSGKPVCTRDGRKARLICLDKKGAYPIVALVNDYNEEEYIKNYDEFGKKFIGGETSDDLMMLPEKKEGWVNVYKERCYETREEAIRHIAPSTKYVDTIRVEWEE